MNHPSFMEENFLAEASRIVKSSGRDEIQRNSDNSSSRRILVGDFDDEDVADPITEDLFNSEEDFNYGPHHTTDELLVKTHLIPPGMNFWGNDASDRQYADADDNDAAMISEDHTHLHDDMIAPINDLFVNDDDAAPDSNNIHYHHQYLVDHGGNPIDEDHVIGASPFAPSSPSTLGSSMDGTSDMEDYQEEDDDIDAVLINPTSADAAHFNPVAPSDMDSVVARQMSKLSMQDREKVLFDIHGVSEEIPETPELVETKLQEFEAALVSQSPSPALDLAKSLDPAYVENREFRLSFLRADLWDAPKAAQRFFLHWQAKLDLFGPALLVQDITQDDLDEATMEALYSGLVQYLPLRDRAGRLVHVSFYHPDEISLEAKLKRTFYMSMVSSEDIETQRKGRVAIGYLAGQNIPGRPRNDWQVAKLLNALPVRMEAIHLCHDRLSIWSPIFAVFKYVATLFTRLRIREHHGSNDDCLFSLQTFGIPTKNCFPLEQVEGEDFARVTNVEHSRFWNKRRNLERLRKRHAIFPQESMQAALAAATVDNISEPHTPSGGDVPNVEAKQEADGEDNKNVQNQAAPTPPNATLSAAVAGEGAPGPTQNSSPPKKPSKSQKNKSAELLVGDLLQTRISVPGRNDVLLGRGKGFYQHTGNIRFRHWIESRSQAYDQARTSSEKKKIIAEVIGLVEQEGGRFLKDDRQCGWILVSPDTARQKVAHVFRSLRPPGSGTIGAPGDGGGGSRKSGLVVSSDDATSMTSAGDSKKRARI